jgi:ABC-type lipoprotein release transport system permease subunit
MGFSAVLTPVIGAREYVMIDALVLATGILASIYPARKALKLNPVAALRAE